MNSFYGHLRERLAVIVHRRSRVYPRDVDFTPPPERSASDLITELGLIEDLIPLRELSGWRSPARILVTGGSPALLAWLGAAAPGIELTAIHGAQDGLAKVTNADAIIGWFTPEMLVCGPHLRWLQLHTAGAENALCSPNLAERGIIVTSLARTAAPVIAEHVFGMLLSLSRKLDFYRERQRRARWSQFEIDPNHLGALRDKTLLIAGLGGVGTEVARLGHAFGARVLATRASGGDAPSYVLKAAPGGSLPDLLGAADIVVNALPLTRETRGLFNESLFSRMKPTATFVNVARGASVATDDLVRALRTGVVGAAALDVTDPEPLPPTHPLWRLPNVILTPHVAGLCKASTDRGWLVIRENLRRFSLGEPLLSVVQPERGY
jgi:phosphoglycerate dehydrogenase-like enzyme